MIARPFAKELFAESLRDLAGSMPANRITVRDIAHNCGYSTASFYRYFKDKYELIAWDYSIGLNQIMAQVGHDGYHWRDTLLDGAKLYWEQRQYIHNFIQHTAGHESYENIMIGHNLKSLRNCVLNLTGGESLDHETELYMRMYCMGTIRLCCEWLAGSFSADPSEIAKIWENSLPQPLHPFLYATL